MKSIKGYVEIQKFVGPGLEIACCWMKFMKLWEYFMQIRINLISVYAQEFYDVKKDLQVCCIKFTTMYMQNEFFEWGGCIDCQGNI